MQVRMEVVRGAKTKQIMLRLPTVIGRGGGAKVKLPASTVSRHHCEIYEHEGQVVVRDLGSSNGTVVNGHKIKGPTYMTPQDELTIGPLTARLHQVPAPARVSQSPAAIDPADPRAAAAPDFEELPVEEDEPVEAMEAATDVGATVPLVAEEPSAEEGSISRQESVLNSPTSQTGDDDGSILEYAEPPASGRSFVGISGADDVPPVSQSPVFDGVEEAEKPEVQSDDSALNQFFDNLDE